MRTSTCDLCDWYGEQLRVVGWAGVIIDGAVRDSAVLATLDLGVMALGTMPRRSNKNGEGQVGIPVEIGGVICAPGDAVFADDDGIVLVDPSLLTADDRI